MKKGISFIGLLALFGVLAPNSVYASEYWKASTFKVDGEIASFTPSYEGALPSYPSVMVKWEGMEKTSHAELNMTRYMSRYEVNDFSMNLKTNDLSEDKNYVISLKSDFIDKELKYRGNVLNEGITLTIDDAKGRVLVSIHEENTNNLIKYQLNGCDNVPTTMMCDPSSALNDMLDDVDIYFDEQRIVPELDKIYENILVNGKVKVDVVKPKEGDFTESIISAGLRKYSTDRYMITGYIDGEHEILSIYDNETGDYNSYVVEYEYVKPNKNVSSIIDSVSGKLNFTWNDFETDYNKRFIVEDLDSINYLYNTQRTKNEIAALNSIVNYSSKIHDLAGNANIDFMFDIRAGGSDSEFTEMFVGPMNILYDGVIYNNIDPIGYSLTKIIYVPDNTPKTRESFISAAYERINEYLKGIDVEIRYGGKLEDLDEVQYCWEKYENNTLSYERLFDADKTNGEWYIIKIGEVEYKYFIVQDSTKMNTPFVNTKDLNTNIYVTTSAFDAPLDSRLNTNKLDENSSEYKELMDKLNVIKGLAYDLNLYSSSLDMRISKLSNGMFNVYIPVDDEMAKKDLVALYVKEDGTIERHNVKIENGYAIFETNHFSTYTLVDSELVNPETGDSVLLDIALFIVSFVGIISFILFKYNKILISRK